MEKTDFVPSCLMSTNLSPDLLCGAQSVPETIDLRDLMLKTEDQGSTSTCAAHTATSWAEGINWRKTGIQTQLDPYKVYDYAKTIDGYPGEDGTTLDAVLKALIHFNMIENTGDIYCTSSITNLKKLIHKYGPVLTAFNCSDSWMKHYDKLVLQGDPGKSCGGHAVICTGYTRAGLLIQNSWGVSWGKYGFACLPWDLVDKQFQYCAIIKNCLNNMN